MTPPTNPGQERVAKVVTSTDGLRRLTVKIGENRISSFDFECDAEDFAYVLNTALSPLLTELEALRAVVAKADELNKASAELLDFTGTREVFTAGHTHPRSRAVKASIDAYESAKKSALLGGEGKP